MTIVNYASSVINKLEALLTDDARVIIYDRHVFIVQATEGDKRSKEFPLKNSWEKIETWRLYYKTFYRCNLQIFVIS